MMLMVDRELCKDRFCIVGLVERNCRKTEPGEEDIVEWESFIQENYGEEREGWLLEKV